MKEIIQHRLKTKLNLLVLIALVGLVGCNKGSGSGLVNNQGELIGVKYGNTNWKPTKPKGMVLIPKGSLVMGQSNYDMAALNNASSRSVTVSSFYMDETEITNSEYRQFVFWVRDSLIRTALAEKAETVGSEMAQYAFLGSELNQENSDNTSAYYEYLKSSGNDRGSSSLNALDWNADLSFDTNDYANVDYAEVIESFYYPSEERLDGQKTIDVRKLKYSYNWLDMENAVKGGSRSNHLYKEEILIYPDTTVWARDFNYSYNEPMHRQYFWHPAFKDYPVVGASWKQANAFCFWRTKLKNGYLKSKKKESVFEFRLPTESEWEYAARGGHDAAPYPWGGPYLVDDRGCFLANFKPQRGNYIEDGFMYTTKANSFEPNNFGLYNMSGNVSEWTNTSYNDGAYNRVSTLNPYLQEGNKRSQKKVIRGGSWKDVAYYLQVGTRDWEWSDSARSYIGFRTVQSHPGIEK